MAAQANNHRTLSGAVSLQLRLAACYSGLLLWRVSTGDEQLAVLAVQAGRAGRAWPAVSALVVLHYNMPAFWHRIECAAGRPVGLLLHFANELFIMFRAY